MRVLRYIWLRIKTKNNLGIINPIESHFLFFFFFFCYFTIKSVQFGRMHFFFNFYFKIMLDLQQDDRVVQSILIYASTKMIKTRVMKFLQ